tara:strand:- start:32 stop:430 length:399 start_codon:yes stop_codon:yes gene_type:complete
MVNIEIDSFEDFLLCGSYKNLSIRNGDIILEEKKKTNQIACFNCVQVFCIDSIGDEHWITEKKKIDNYCDITVFCPYCKMDCLVPLSKIHGKNETEKTNFLKDLSKKMENVQNKIKECNLNMKDKNFTKKFE